MKLINELDDFQSHSIHYVMVGSNNTEDIRLLFDPQYQSSTIQAIDACRSLGDRVFLKDVATNSSCFLVLDTRRFSQFSIDNFEITMYPQSLSNPKSLSSYVHYTEGKLRIIDSVGISFANFMQYMTEKLLQVNFTGAVFALRILFVGHLSDGSSKMVQSITIPVTFQDIKLDLNDVRGIYDCTFMPVVSLKDYGNGADWTNIGNATSYFSGTSVNNLGDLVQSFEDNLNKESLKLYQAMTARVVNRGQSFKNVDSIGRPVQYMITIPESWAKYQFSGPSQGAATETNFVDVLKQEDLRRAQTSENQEKKTQNTGTPVTKDSYLTVPAGWTIMQVLDKMFAQCIEISKLANFASTESTPKSVKFYKQLVMLTSDAETFTVHVDVIEFEVPNVYLAESGQASQITEKDDAIFEKRMVNGKEVKVPRNFIEFDYIFSGRNIDVLQLDLNIQNLAFMLSNKIAVGSANLVSNVSAETPENGKGVTNDQHVVQSFRQKDPVLIPRLTQSQKNNFSDFSANATTSDNSSPQEINQQFTQNLSNWYFQSPVQAKMIMRGNPHFLSKATFQFLPEHIRPRTLVDDSGTVSTANSSVKQTYRKKLEEHLAGPNMARQSDGSFRVTGQLSGPNIASSPLFAKINIFGPNVNFINAEPIAGQDFAQKLFDTGYFNVMEVVSKIENSKFTQELKLYSNGLYGAPSITAQGAQAKPNPQE
jgi:hypothetical protein